MQKILIRILAVIVCAGMLLSLTGCSQQDAEEITKAVTDFVTACGNSDYGLATQYIDSSVIENPTDESGMIWLQMPTIVKEKMSDNSVADVEVRKYIGQGLKLMFDGAELQEIKQEGDEAVVILTGTGKILHWESVNSIYDKISAKTEEEFVGDYEWYKQKIKDKGQATVFKDIRNKVTPKVFTELGGNLKSQETIKYVKQVTVKKDKEGDWKITKIVTREDDGSSDNWFGDVETTEGQDKGE